ncbi:MAG: pyridoxal 5'-phosphate synthase glutaminase subunit PdxT [Candidatus Sericytochromatia bacterium]|nr:pyridoxal 5'-phosphate synthase glutaminase subunit PdxT [Candidatus Sericytochromatia bacterium]
MGQVGILALQGAFAKHGEALDRLGVAWCLVRTADDLAGVDRLIIPGGESTTMTRLLRTEGWWPQLKAFAEQHPVMGTCAGLIMLAHALAEPDSRVAPLGVLDVTVDRNAYGRQTESFSAPLQTSAWPEGAPFQGVFIRAPRVTACGPGVAVVARLGDEPVAVRQGGWLGLAFHPELTGDDRFHRYFLDAC